jgi:hypothetical protein
MSGGRKGERVARRIVEAAVLTAIVIGVLATVAIRLVQPATSARLSTAEVEQSARTSVHGQGAVERTSCKRTSVREIWTCYVLFDHGRRLTLRATRYTKHKGLGIDVLSR